MSNYYVITRSPDYLEHHGILGMKWGVRRFQNKDGSLTPEGRARYGDVLTKKQMQGYIHDYNLRTGSNKTINKNTVFKTPNGMYDYKGRKINTDTTVEDPMNKVEKKTETKPKKLSEMTDEELRAANNRMKDEEDYKRHLANAMPPEKVSYMKTFMGNLKDNLVKNIPDSIGTGISGAISEAIKNALKEEKPKEQPKKTNLRQDPNRVSDDEAKAMAARAESIKKYYTAMNGIDDYFVDKGKEMLADYWDDGDRSVKLAERSQSNINGDPLDPNNIRPYLEDKRRR